MIAREGHRVERVGKDDKGLKSLKIEDTMQEVRGEMNTSYQGNPDGVSRVLGKGGGVCVTRHLNSVKKPREEGEGGMWQSSTSTQQENTNDKPMTK